MPNILRTMVFIGLLSFACSGAPKKEVSQNSLLNSPMKMKSEEWHDGIYYEIFVRSFKDSNNDGIGDLNGITLKLDYLKSLGVTGIWLTPIFPSPSYHGYDANDFESINPDFGDPSSILIISSVKLTHEK